MSRIKACFSALKNNKKKALIPFITAGDPSFDITVELMHVLTEAGADIIELGVPFSDPMADGPVIQRASERALSNGTNTDDVFNMVKKFRIKNESTPIEVMGYEIFVKKAANVGVDALIVVDLPPEESAEFGEVLKPYGIDQIFLISPTTQGRRLDRICEVATGFLYYVSLKGVTGSSQLDVNSIKDKLNEIRSKTLLPLGVGFGIKDPQIAEDVGRVCDAVIVGSALVERIAAHAENSEKMKLEISSFMRSLRTALNNIG